VRGIFAKPLDWCVIQLARRHVRIDPASDRRRAGLEELLKARDLFDQPDLPRIGCPFHEETRLLYHSPVATRFPENNIVVGRWHAAGENWRACPTVILLHGWNAALCYRYIFPVMAAGLRRQGVNVAMIELPYHMHRRPAGAGAADFISSDVERTVEAARQAVADVRVLCDWFLSQGVPAAGVWGFSLGAWLAGLAIMAEPRLGFAVLTTPIARIDRVIAELPFCEPVRRSLENLNFDFGHLNLCSRRPLVAPEKILIMESQHDLFAPVETVEELWEAWGRPEIWRLQHGHISVLASPWIMRRAIRWIGAAAWGRVSAGL
jgi:hypothetical protein